MKRAGKYFGIVVIILLMTAAVLVFLAPHFGWRVDAVFSGSMEPEFQTGGVVITRPVEAADIKIGDVITFNSPLSEQLTSHRVVAAEGGSSFRFRTKGDANEDTDPFVLPAENVVGQVCVYLPYFGYATQFIKTPLGLLLTLCLPGLVIVVLEMRNIWLVFTEEKI